MIGSTRYLIELFYTIFATLVVNRLMYVEQIKKMEENMKQVHENSI